MMLTFTLFHTLRANIMVMVASNKKTPTEEPLTMTFRCDAKLARALEEFRDAQRVKPNKSDVLVLALQEFLREEGYYPSDAD